MKRRLKVFAEKAVFFSRRRNNVCEHWASISPTRIHSHTLHSTRAITFSPLWLRYLWFLDDFIAFPRQSTRVAAGKDKKTVEETRENETRMFIPRFSEFRRRFRVVDSTFTSQQQRSLIFIIIYSRLCSVQSSPLERSWLFFIFLAFFLFFL